MDHAGVADGRTRTVCQGIPPFESVAIPSKSVGAEVIRKVQSLWCHGPNATI